MGPWMQTATAKVLGIGVLALTDAKPYGLVAADPYARPVGALVLLATEALLMYLTRRIDWYACMPALGKLPAAIMEKP